MCVCVRRTYVRMYIQFSSLPGFIDGFRVFVAGSRGLTCDRADAGACPTNNRPQSRRINIMATRPKGQTREGPQTPFTRRDGRGTTNTYPRALDLFLVEIFKLFSNHSRLLWCKSEAIFFYLGVFFFDLNINAAQIVSRQAFYFRMFLNTHISIQKIAGNWLISI